MLPCLFAGAVSLHICFGYFPTFFPRTILPPVCWSCFFVCLLGLFTLLFVGAVILALNQLFFHVFFVAFVSFASFLAVGLGS